MEYIDIERCQLHSNSKTTKCPKDIRDTHSYTKHLGRISVVDLRFTLEKFRDLKTMPSISSLPRATKLRPNN